MMKSILRAKSIPTLAVYAIVAVVVYIFSSQLQWTADDIAYQFRFDNGEPVLSVSDIIPSQVYHYYNSNGRFLWHSHTQLYTALLGHVIFGIFNALAYVTLILYTLLLAGGNLRRFSCVLTATLLLLLMLDTHFVPSCQIGFVWGACLTLIFILLFMHKPKPQIMWQKVCAAILLFVYSFVAGTFCEVYSVGVSCALALYALTNMRRLTYADWAMGVGYVLGCAVLCLSPASIHRADTMDISLMFSLMHFAVFSRALYIFVVVFLYKLLTRQIKFKSFVADNRYYFVAMLALVCFAFAVGVESNRQLFGVELFSVILTIKLLRNHTFSPWVLAVFSVIVAYIYILKWQQISTFNDKYFEYYDKIADSQDLRVYIDFPERIKAVDATRCFAISEGNVYESGSIYCLQHGHYTEDYPQIVTLPAAFDSILALPVENRVWEFLPNRYILFQDVEHPAKFVHHRNYNILGIKRPFPSYEVSFDSVSPLNTPNYRVQIVSFYVPFIEDAGIEIK